jgi:Cd2+/Zn2+-exporting ATPase
MTAAHVKRVWAAHGEAISAAVCALFVLAGLLVSRAAPSTPVSTALFFCAYVIGGYRQAIEGVGQLIRERELDVDLLMVVAAIGYWADGALLIFIFSLSGALEGYASRRTQRDIEALVALYPQQAVVLREGVQQAVAASSIVVGDVLVVRPGERIAADGEIVEGSSAIDQATITGESMPVDKKQGDGVFAGTLNGHGALRVRASRAAAESVLARIVALVREAEATRPPAQLFIERFEKAYSKFVVLGALLVAFVPLLFGLTFRESLYRSMIFLVVASPCALAAAMMPTLLSALSNGARSGVLFKGSSFIEGLGRVRAIAFDKTGTLTQGVPRVTDVLALEGSSDALLAAAAGVESFSEHPLGRAIVREASSRGLAVQEGSAMRAIAGRGALASLGTESWRVGKPDLFEEVSEELIAAREKLEAEGKTVVVVGRERSLGLIALRDSVRPEASAAIARLRALGVEHIVMLTGDAGPTARAIAEEVGIHEVRAELLPEDKVRAIQELVKAYGQVAMVGDGVNDAPAMAAATLGIAMGGTGTDVALETADIVLTSDDLMKLPYAVKLGRRALSVVKQNLVVALGMMTVLVVVDLLGRIGLPLGVIGHEGSTLLVTLNGLRLLRRWSERPVAGARSLKA